MDTRYTNPNSEVVIRLRGSEANGGAAIVVEDHGPGVPAGDLAQLFVPFYRVGEDRDRQSGGVGLGLAITQRIVALHRGSVSAANREAGGLEVRLTFPATDVS